MGKQYDKVIKRRRRKAYLARKKEATKTSARKPVKARKPAAKKPAPSPTQTPAAEAASSQATIGAGAEPAA